MINLTLGDYRICTLENGTVALCERHIISKRSSPNLGKTVERVIGHHFSLKSALSAYTAREIASDDYCAETVEQLEAVLNNLASRIEKALEGINHD